jgi:CubicO group peptidase (beta-lactamase class C family)
MMWTPLKTADGKEDPYGLGWRIGEDLGVLDAQHSGSQQGTSTFITIVPERRAGIVVLINLEDGHASDLGTDLMKIVLGATQPTSKIGSTR